MCNDLISRCALLEIFSKNSIFQAVTNSCGKSVIEIIEEQPIAFDLDKVVEQIRKATDEYGLVDYVNDKPMITKEQAIEIIKKGGIE